MARFSPTDAAFEGFRLTREHPRAVVAWAGIYLVFSTLLYGIGLLTLGAQFSDLLGRFANNTASQDDFWKAMTAVQPFLLVAAPAFILFSAVMNCAVYRMVLRPGEAVFSYIRLGADELRVAGVIVVFWLIWGLMVFVVSLVALTGGTYGGEAATLGWTLLTLAACAYSVFVMVRLSLAAPITFVTKRFTLMGSWRATQGMFWRLLGAYALAFGLGLGALMLMGFVVATVEKIGLMLTGAPTSGPAMVIGLVVQIGAALSTTCYRLITSSPPAAIYKALTGHTRAENW